MKELGKKLLFPPVWFLVVAVFLSAVLLGAVFANGLNRSAFAMAVYPFSAYTLAVLVAAAIRKAQGLKKVLNRNRFYRRYTADMEFKAMVSLCLSLGISLVYSFYKAFAGVYYHSVWFGTEAAYYMILSTARFSILRQVRQTETDREEALKKYERCGYLLLVLTIVIIGMNIYRIHEGEVTVYPGHIIYAAAGYTFYSFASAIVNIVKYRKAENPLYHASKIIVLATALVSVFSLQTAMFAEFGGDYTQQRTMNIATGFVVYLTVIGLALFMIIRGKRMRNRKNL